MKALATSADEHAKLVAAKQAQEMLLVEHLSNLNISSSNSKGIALESLSPTITGEDSETLEQTEIENDETENLINFEDKEESNDPMLCQSLPPLRNRQSFSKMSKKYSDYNHKGSQGLGYLYVVILVVIFQGCLLWLQNHKFEINTSNFVLPTCTYVVVFSN